jgi:hypothetical protein
MLNVPLTAGQSGNHNCTEISVYLKDTADSFEILLLMNTCCGWLLEGCLLNL